MGQVEPQRMQCMEVWGGNQATQQRFDAPGLRIWIYSRPHGKAASGGDVYYLSSCASGRITRVLLADVSGHGAAVSSVAISLRDLMRGNVNRIKQTRLVQAMNRQFAELADEGQFATALVGTFFSSKKTYVLCNAGHPPPAVFRAASAAWSHVASPEDDAPIAASPSAIDTPLGVIGDASYTQLDLRLAPGDMVLSYSDALPEAEDDEGRPLGQAGVLAMLRGMSQTPADELIPGLLSRIGNLSESNLHRDDVTLILCQAKGGGPTIKDNLLAPLRLFGQVKDRTRIG